jgi:hypothetical protein
MAIGSTSEDRAAGWLETCVENVLIRLSRISRKVWELFMFTADID